MDGGLFNPAIPRHYWDPRYGFHWREDFLTSYTGIFQQTVQGAGSGLNQNTWPQGTALPSSDWVGITRFATGSTATGYATIGTLWPIPLGLGATWAETRVRLESLSDGTDTYTFRFGYLDSFSGEAVDAVGLRYTDAVNGGRWQAYTRNGNTETAADTGITAALATDYKLRIEVNAAANQALFYINGALIATISTNIPNGITRFTGIGAQMIKSVGVTNKNIMMDYVECDYIFTNPRS
jgi:hypothetical protein